MKVTEIKTHLVRSARGERSSWVFVEGCTGEGVGGLGDATQSVDQTRAGHRAGDERSRKIPHSKRIRYSQVPQMVKYRRQVVRKVSDIFPPANQ